MKEMRRKMNYKFLTLILCGAMLIGTGEMPVMAAELFQDGSEEETEVTEEAEAFSSGEEPELFLAPEEEATGAPEEEFTASPASSGTVKGTKVTWKFKDGVLTVAGKGAVPSHVKYFDVDTGKWYEEHLPPWHHLISKVEEIQVLNGVTGLGSSVFDGCVNTKKVTIAGSVKKLGAVCFNKCESLKEINLEDGLEIIEEGAFNYCRITEITIPSTVRYNTDAETFGIGLNGMPNLEKVLVKGKSKNCKSVDGVVFIKNGTELAFFPPVYQGTTYEIPYGTKVIHNNTFAGASQTTIKIPETVTKIGPYAFYYCYNLKELVFPGSVKTIPESVCDSCENLTSVIFKKGVKEIKENAFYSCVSLSQAELPETMRRIETKAFYNCKALTSIKLPSSLVELSGTAFDKNTKFVLDKPIPNFNKIENGEFIFSAPVKVKGKNRYKEAFTLLSAINKERKEAGSPALIMDKKLLECAMKRAAEVSLYSSNNRPVNRPYYSMNPGIDGELISWGDKNYKEVLGYWMSGYGYKLTLLNSSFTSVGVGCMEVGGVKYWTICFGEKKGTPVKSSSYKDKTVSCKVLVALEEKVCEPEIFLTRTSMRKGETSKVQVYWNGKYLTDSGINLVSSNPKVCKVEKETLRGVAPGTAVIYAYYGANKEYAKKIKVKIGK